MNRREALRTLSVGALVGASAGGMAIMATPSASAVHDPMLDLIERYRAQTEVFNKLPDMPDAELYAQIDATYGPLMDELCNNPPPVTTVHGAIEAIRFALEEMEHSVGGYAFPVVGAALAFLETLSLVEGRA